MVKIMINICAAIHDANGNYSKYAAVAFRSIINNTSERLHFFVLHDDTFMEQQKGKLARMIEEGGNEIDFYEVSIPEDWKKLKSIKNFTIGTLFRLMISDKLPRDIGRVIYIDADILVNLDIKELWDIDIGNALVCGRKEKHYDNPIFDEGISEDSYVNAGVLIFNLDKIREKHDLYRESIRFFERHPNCMWNDEDAINFVLNKKQKIIPNRFNTFTVFAEEAEPEFLKHCIYHFAGDHPRANGSRAFDREFFRTLRQTPWGEEDEDIFAYFYGQNALREESFVNIRRISYAMGTKKNIVFWGAKETEPYKKIKAIYDLSDREVWAVDGDKGRQGEVFDGMRVESPDKLKGMQEGTFVVVLAYNHYRAISRALSGMGYREGYGYADSRFLLSEPEGGRYLL